MEGRVWDPVPVCTHVRHVDVTPCIVGYCVQCYECNVWKAWVWDPVLYVLM